MSNGRINARSAIENIAQVTGRAETVVLEDIARRLDKASPAPSVFHQDTGAEITPNILKQFFQAIALGEVVILNTGENGPTKTCHDWDMPTDKCEPPIGEFEFYPADLLTLLKFENGLIRPYLAEHIEQLDRQWRYGNRTPQKSTQPCEPQAAPAATVEAVVVTPPVPAVEDKNQDDDATPGKIPNVRHGKLAVKAAWQIECTTGKLATVEQVIETLQSWVDSDDYPELLEKIAHGVRYATISGKDKTYEEGACRKTLGVWNKSRQ